MDDGTGSSDKYPDDDDGGDKLLLLLIARGRCVVYGADRADVVRSVVATLPYRSHVVAVLVSCW